MKYTLVTLGASLGGLQAVRTVLAALPPGFRLPLALAQHRTADAGDALSFVLGQACALPVREAYDKSAITPGVLHVGPAGYHLMVEGSHFALATSDPFAYERPSIDVLFESAAETCGPRLIAVVLSGTGADGASGLAMVVRRGGVAIVQAPDSAYAAAMPRAAAQAAARSTLLPLAHIGPHLARLGQGG